MANSQMNKAAPKIRSKATISTKVNLQSILLNFFPSSLVFQTMEEHILDTNVGKHWVCCHRFLVNSGVEKMNNI
jgi:hypothetical protein